MLITDKMSLDAFMLIIGFGKEFPELFARRGEESLFLFIQEALKKLTEILRHLLCVTKVSPSANLLRLRKSPEITVALILFFGSIR